MTIDQRMEKLELLVEAIKDNHIAHLAKDIQDHGKTLVFIANDVSWLKAFFWVIATASVGSLFSAIVSLFIFYTRLL